MILSQLRTLIDFVSSTFAINDVNVQVNAFLTVHNHPRPPRAQTGEEAATEAGFWSNVASCKYIVRGRGAS